MYSNSNTFFQGHRFGKDHDVDSQNEEPDRCV